MKKYMAALLISSATLFADEPPKFERVDQLELENATLKIQSLNAQIVSEVARRDAVFKKYGYKVTADGHVVKEEPKTAVAKAPDGKAKKK